MRHLRQFISSISKVEKEKKEKYNARVLNIEKASFCPLVFLTTGGMSPECEALNKRIATLIANKTSENYSQVMTYLRTRLRFALLKATVIAVRGYTEVGLKKKKQRVVLMKSLLILFLKSKGWSQCFEPFLFYIFEYFISIFLY